MIVRFPKNKVLSFYAIELAIMSSPPTYNNNVGSIDSPTVLLSVYNIYSGTSSLVIILSFDVEILSITIIGCYEFPGPLTPISVVTKSASPFNISIILPSFNFTLGFKDLLNT